MVMGFALQAQQEYIELGSIISRGGSSLVSSNEQMLRDGISNYITQNMYVFTIVS